MLYLPSLLLATFLHRLPVSALPALDVASDVDAEVYSKDVPCPGNLPASPDFEFPHLIIPISSSNPTTAYPNTFVPNITAGDISDIFDFDIPESRVGQTCTIQFLFPRLDQLKTSFFQLRGFGTYSFSMSALGVGAVEGNTTFDNRPLPAYVHGFPKAVSMQPGNAYEIGSTICVAGRISMTMSSFDSSLAWFQDFNPCPMGLFITYSP
ncbi:hypothetical protein HRR83_001492 [Exophiala dermatitidis]|uniref:Ubiquitin 3 binding protein But2 C-terminal domain-containing protein n=2 Tax=Exophiala dermatitidis TaxID=5970 RepID=H6C692_EXODN|nr:uncharacterized protein HMPREF1120_07231 [Exophiala dermatitidis NIH/UT8656]KAJ4526301.1 hypothetical protein HRR74_001496 [Exophiala dermatitidis]EHY59238.1 hypothetical protein HMPREF1120_07231 [Exophiala dermatitidis NIH/UT8656]KAJ4526756.1 hypothetical protein HRR73_001551 [Exophiala dermatitidis]KAJ4532462.1 hypothetical protein HRR76_007454 [Exophiala dermatitidis]KAJ4547029.1 hypothetical protein HRR77_004565 [Exophiala dermatitidis]